MITMKRRTVIAVLGGLILCTVIGLCIWWFLSSSQKPHEVEDIKLAIGKHYLLPSDEEPALLTVEDKTKVTSSFFARAENGDKILVYKNNKKALLYRPSIDKIIEVGPVSMADMTQP